MAEQDIVDSKAKEKKVGTDGKLIGRSDEDIICPKCKNTLKMNNVIIGYGDEPINKDDFEIKFRQIFYDIICKKCNEKCISVSNLEEYEKVTKYQAYGVYK